MVAYNKHKINKKQTKPPKNMKNKKKPQKKLYELDTSVPIHDFECFSAFEEHDVELSSIVLDELDSLKVKSPEKAYSVRQIQRYLEELGMQKSATNEDSFALFEEGVSLGKGKGNLRIFKSNLSLAPEVGKFYNENKNDHFILSSVIQRIAEEKNKGKNARKVIFITKDRNLRLKAKTLGILVQDYEHDKVNPAALVEKNIFENDKFSGIIDEIYSKNEIERSVLENLLPKNALYTNKSFILKTRTKNALCICKKEKIILVKKITVSGITPRNSEQVFLVNAIMDPSILLIAAQGPAGTGKSLLAIAAALELLKKKLHKRIFLSSAMVTVGNKEMGALPGSAIEKVTPFMKGFTSNLKKITENERNEAVSQSQPTKNSTKKNSTKKNSKNAESKEQPTGYFSLSLEHGEIIIEPIAYLRGANLFDAVVIVDEVQNLTRHEAKTIITRACDNTKVIILGDIGQIDCNYLDRTSNGLSYVIAKMSGHDIVGIVNLIKSERGPLAKLAGEVL